MNGFSTENNRLYSRIECIGLNIYTHLEFLLEFLWPIEWEDTQITIVSTEPTGRLAKPMNPSTTAFLAASELTFLPAR